MRYDDLNLGVSTADAEKVSLRFERGDLQVTFHDWQERPRTVTFNDVLAFRWQELDDPVPRDDRAFEVVASPWLERQAALQSEPVDQFHHYVLCFNAYGALDVLARAVSAV